MIYGVDSRYPVEIDTLTWRRSQFNEEENEVEIICTFYLIEET